MKSFGLLLLGIFAFSTTSCSLFRKMLPSKPAAEKQAGPVVIDTGNQSLDAMNRLRQSEGKAPLRYHEGLENLAREHSASMASRQKMDHQGFGTRANASRNDYSMGLCAENVAKITPSTSIPSVIELWANSPGHRKNMLGDYDHVGFALAPGGSNHYATAFFARKTDMPDDSGMQTPRSGGLLPFPIPFF